MDFAKFLTLRPQKTYGVRFSIASSCCFWTLGTNSFNFALNLGKTGLLYFAAQQTSTAKVPVFF